MVVKVLVIGVGKMGLAHLKVLKDLNPDAIGAWAPTSRAKKEVQNLQATFFENSLSDTIKILNPSHVIVASPIETLFANTFEIIKLGIKNILVEKPMVLNNAEARELSILIKKHKVNLKVAYNRRHYASLNTALKLIKQSDEKIKSIYFEFNERFFSSNGPMNKASKVKNKWILANSMHVIDLAFSQVGLPIYSKSSFSYKYDDLKWHPSGSIFYGSGITEKNVPFVYHANWNSPGNWKIEWMTNSNRYIFNPLEKLSVIRRNSYKIEDILFDDSLDINYKPGIFLQNKDFLYGDKSRLVSSDYAIKLLYLAEIFGGYDK